ncbi:DUF4326 domain-containing protein [Paraburkholderia sediminicola]|uniref:DUF4326 domain-containing protein n=1 Tax=Paraburkholderia sediminicola TaxID=458836 RepID=UPI0038BB2B18
MAQRIQLKRTKGWRMPANAVKVDRSTRWGNPFHTHGDGYPMEASVAVDLFARQMVAGGTVTGRRNRVTTVDDVRRDLRGKNLACWCPPDAPCHADVLLAIANS